MRSIPVVRGLERRYAPRGLRVIGIHEWRSGEAETRTAIDEARREHGARWPTYLDVGGALSAKYGGLSLPAFYVVGRDGTLRWMQNGRLVAGEATVSTLEREILAAIEG